MRLEFDEWLIRSWRPDDVSGLVKYANNRRVSRTLRDAFPYPYTTEDARAWLRFATQEQPEANYAIASPKEAIGGIGLKLGNDVFSRSAEIGYWLGEPYWGKGIATGAVSAFTRFAFSNYDLARIEARVYENNPASARVLEKAGYVCEGRLRKSITKDGRTMDHFLYATVLE
ncbi:MAG: GNAT family N-acetyltransferase [Chloroflexi bacterium]|nr:GNAT family N-acetyltransferase [Chloroflexota bacterium]